ncbi:benenodin family lasso peptide [Luteimonas saliphila]|nr:benenodin family lasso peptide [Luteimonas saliphila]
MNKTNDNNARDSLEGMIDLGVASVETKGPLGPQEGTGEGRPVIPGISDE